MNAAQVIESEQANGTGNEDIDNGDANAVAGAGDGGDSGESGESGDTDGSEDDDGAGKDKGEQHGNRLQRRIDRLTREKYEFKARAEVAERMLNKGESAADVERRAGEAPNRETFDSDADYEEAVVNYRIDQKVNKAVAEQMRKISSNSTASAWEQRKAEAKKQLPDYDEVMEDSPTVLSPAMEEAVVSSEVGAHIAYHLAKHPDEAADIFKLSPIAQARAIGAIEARLSGKLPSRKRDSGAPPPVTPVGGAGKGGTHKDPDKMSMAEFVAWRNRASKK